ncbi:pyruvate kinase 1, cytosolic-like protein [Tanacetum coccineum]|uniref:pyruvate kinase n=1 Tax=Tanacetum coccineum TaxID=301880 RepID=A0ABQ5FGV8_9ASTR
MASILEPSKPTFFPAMNKIVGTLGPKSRSVEIISSCLNAGMSVARFDFSWGDAEFHQQTLENLKLAIKRTKKLCAVMLDTVGPELQVLNKTERPISLDAETLVTLTPNQEKEATSNLLPINFSGLSKAVKTGDTIFIGQYLFTGSETTSVWLEVNEVKGEDVVCLIKNSATLSGSLFTLHVSQILNVSFGNIADVLVFRWIGGKHACVDLIGVSPLVGLSSRGFTVGHAALKAASCKVTKHEKACIENQDVFILLAFDTFDFFAHEAVAVAEPENHKIGGKKNLTTTMEIKLYSWVVQAWLEVNVLSQSHSIVLIVFCD